MSHTPPLSPPPGPDAGAPVSGRLGILKPLRSRDFRLLAIGLTISLVGDGVYYVALAFQVLELSNSPASLSLVGFAWTGSMTVFLLWGGAAADRYERRTILLISDTLRALSIGALGILSIAGSVELWQVIALSTVYGAATAFFQPAYMAIVPDVVPGSLLVEANSFGQFVEPLALRFAGPALGGVIAGTWGPGYAFLLDGVSFLASVGCVYLLDVRRMPARDNAETIRSQIAAGVRYVRTEPWIWGTLLSAAIGLLAFWGPWEVLVPYVVKNDLGGGAGTYGLIVAAGGVGAILASIWMGQSGLPRKHILVMYLAWAFGCLVVAGYAFVTDVWQAIAVAFVLSACFSIGLIIWNTLMHMLVPRELLGRVTSLDWFVSGGLVPLSFGLTGPIAVAIGTDATLIGAGVLGCAATLAFLLFPGMRDTERDGRVHPGEVDASRGANIRDGGRGL